MIKIIRRELANLLDLIDSGNSNINEEELLEIINLFAKINDKYLSKLEAADYIGKSRATFDNYIDKGLIPKGIKRQGISSLFWSKSDLDKFLKNENIRKRV